MTHTSLPARAYVDAAWLQRENEGVFQRSFQPVCLASDVASDGAWVCADVGGASVIVQNFAGSLRAFDNVCAHRLSQIRTTEQGCGPLQCPYHGWTYGPDGEVVGAPFRSTFDEAELSAARLTRWETTRFGPMVLVRRCAPLAPDDADGPFGALHHDLDRMCAAMDEQHSARFTMTFACNWKVLVENSIEGLHVPLVHPNTITPLGYAEKAPVRTHGSSSCWFSSSPSPRKARALQLAFPNRPLAFDGYFHALLFPNWTLATPDGCVYLITRMIPTAAQACRLDAFAFLTKHDGDHGADDLREFLLQSNVAFFQRTFEEDKIACEAVQRGARMAHPEARGILSTREDRITEFQSRLIADISTASPQPTRETT